MRTSERTWRTCSPTRSTRTEGPSVALVWGISPSPLQDRKGEEGGAVSAACPHSLYLALSRSEEHTSELQSLMRISYAVFCLKKKNQNSSTVYHTKNTDT